ncbi:MAG TPA: sulfotransferase [Chitinophagales bacterium]|nr:sulfotransferase [Chitinophagales bacterium]HRK27796.1 sulfotransferase [Chitinophagales bacterium]
MSMLKSIVNFKKEIALPAISGGSVRALIKTLQQGKVGKSFYGRAIAATLLSLITEPFRIGERWLYNSRFDRMSLQNPPIFIIGHWRSGTTHLHNFLGQDPQMGFVSTYQSAFPELLFGQPARFIFEKFMRFALPPKRQGDNVVMNPDFPQEEEFALGNIHGLCYYNFWYFPSLTDRFYRRYIDFEGISHAEMQTWKTEYVRLIKKAIANTRGNMFVSKNPPNTGRIEALLNMFPDAKFIHIYRNPVEVFLSTHKFITSMMPSLQLASFTDELTTNNILSVYGKLMRKYLATRSLIPPHQLAEVRFEDLETEPLKELQRIYQHLHLPNFDKAAPFFEQYAATQKTYKKNAFYIEPNLLRRITTEWDFAMQEWGYSVPAHITVKQPAMFSR